MRQDNRSTPLWPDSFRVPVRLPLRESLSADVCVVGAGIAGLSTAYRLALEGAEVVVLEAQGIGSGETERTTAHLTAALDAGWDALTRVHGGFDARLAARSHLDAIDEIERAAGEEGIDCGFERLDGWLFAGEDGPPERLETEYEAAVLAGIPGVERLDRVDAAPFLTGPALRYPRQAQFHPLRYLGGLAAAFERRGGRIFCGTRVASVRGGSRARAVTADGVKVSARAVVIATNTPFNDRLAIHTKQASYRTYVVAAPIEAPSASRALYWDTDEPFHYARFQRGAEGAGDALIVGGEDHKTGQDEGATAGRFERLERWARERFPGMGAVTHRWSGQIVSTCDGLAFIGRNPGDEDNVYIVTGDCGNGMTHGAIAGLLLPELIAGRSHPWEKLYDPARVRSASLARWAGENLNAAAQYRRLLAPSEVSSVDEIEPGSGAVLRRGLTRVAVYRAPDGTLTERSAICPHLRAVVRWNPVEKTWDCPAHGSRFDPEGRVLNGPAAAGLEPVKRPARTRRRRGKSRAPAPGFDKKDA